MMRVIQQYVDETKGRRYYYSTKPLRCDSCGNQLKDFVVVRACWSKNKSFITQLCFNCSQKHRQSTQAEEKIVMSIVNKKPIGTKLVLIRPLELKNSNKDDSLFCNTLEAPYTNNNAKRSFRSDYTVLDDSAPACVGASVDEEKEAEKDKLLESSDELDALISRFKDEQVLISEDKNEIKKIERGEKSVKKNN